MDKSEQPSVLPFIEHHELMTKLRPLHLPAKCGAPTPWTFDDTCDSQIDNLTAFEVAWTIEGFSLSEDGCRYFLERLRERVREQCEGSA